VIEIRDTITDINRTVLAIREMREAIHEGADSNTAFRGRANMLGEMLYDMEDILTAYTVRYRMQYHAIPVKLDDKLYNLARRAGAGEGAPTKAQRLLFEEYVATYANVQDDIDRFLADDFADYNDVLKAAGAGPVETPAHLKR
jgi:hypothetical protein